ncbi:MarR family winged helix-turn-helix transcriptional regulator [Clostridium sp. UBA6640]|uniref:MarR family winged helix-turn-helix transcriptional regulator n=1 Tax=Clostridium sp. UBA6640 TaxID=1946370 RepID=UPI0025C2F1C3|nr:MarR family transcriptional regulator [Clostridium sp. UBA6640]
MNISDRLYMNMKRLVIKIDKDIRHQFINTELNDLSLAEISIIDAIGLNGEKTITEIADFLEVALSTPTKAMDRLVKKGYIVRETDPNDRRLVVAKLTKQGEIASKQLTKNRHELLSSYLKNISKEQVEKLDEILDEIIL